MSPFGTSNSESLFAFGIEEQGKRYLLQTAGWTKFFAITGFVISGIMLLVAAYLFVSGVQAESYSSYFGSSRAERYFSSGIGCFVAVGIYVYPTIMLLRFSNATKRSIQQGSQGMFTAALRYQRNLYVYMGALLIAIIGIYLLLFIFLIAAAGSRIF